MPQDTDKLRHAVAAADTEPRFEVGDTLPIPEVPEPSLPENQRKSGPLPTGMHERSKLGRFDILDILGQGGMGVVVAAYDPQLDRKVAIKVLRTHGLTGRRRVKEAERLQREARAMAQLSHPHVVTVYDAGEIDDRVYIAMEYVAGQTLRSWQVERSADEIIEAYTKAGSGLAAGHQAGLVHRDFKPDNVLVGFDGRIRVIDFGLARPTRTGDTTPTPGRDTDELSSSSPSGGMSTSGLHARLTTVGALFGTPLYMAPEQHKKIELDARADQFAFCIALYEALYGTHPFPTESYITLAAAVIEGKVTPPPERADVPRRVVDAILRGLRPDPDDRFPSMVALLEELQPPAPRKRRVWAWTAGAALGAVAITLGAVWLLGGRAAADPCAPDPERFAGIWDPAVEGDVTAALLASHRAHARDTAQRVKTDLDRYIADWRKHRASVCRATEVDHTQSESLFDLRMECLTHRLDDLSALTHLLRTTDPAIADHAVSATHALPDSRACVDMKSASIPASRVQSAQLAPLRAARATLEANVETQHYANAMALGRDLLARAKRIGYEPFIAEIEFRLGQAEAGAGHAREADRLLQHVLELASRNKLDQLFANVWLTRIAVVGTQRPDEALGFEPIVRMAIDRAGGGPKMLAALEYYLASVSILKSDYTTAIKRYERAIELRTADDKVDRADVVIGKVIGNDTTDSPNTNNDTTFAEAYNGLGGAYLRAGNVVEAKRAFEKAIEIDRRTLGPSHPTTARNVSSLGALAQAMGHWDEATKYHKEALAVLEPILGANHEQVGMLYYSLAISANGREDFKAALPYYQRSLAIFEHISPNHTYVALSLVGTADCYEELGEPAKGVVDGERALAMLTKSKTKDRVQLAMAQFILAKALWAANDDRPRARRLATRAREGFRSGGIAALNGYAAVQEWFEKVDKR